MMMMVMTVQTFLSCLRYNVRTCIESRNVSGEESQNKEGCIDEPLLPTVFVRCGQVNVFLVSSSYSYLDG